MPIVPADPAYRRKVVTWFVAAVIACAVVLLLGMPAFARWLQQQSPRDAARALQIVFGAAFLPTIPMAIAMARLARRIRSSGQFPPPGMKVMVDTELVTGAAAERQSRGFFALAIVLGLAGVIGMVALPIMISRIVLAR
jgi:biotin transporter BioY